MTALEHLSPEWFAARVSKITGSRVAPILGLSPYDTADSILRVMVREHFGAPVEFEGTAATEHGQRMEHRAVDLYEWTNAVTVHGAQEFVTHPEYPWLMVAPDGLVGDDGLLEVKAPYRATYMSISERPDYYAQVQLQLACTGRRWCDFMVFREVDPFTERVEADPSWLPSVLPTLEAFMRLYTETIADPALTQIHLEPLVADREDVAWSVAADEYLAAQAAQADAEARTKNARARLLELADDRPTRGCGVSVLRSERKGALDTKAAESAGVDVEQFRGKPSVVWSVRVAS